MSDRSGRRIRCAWIITAWLLIGAAMNVCVALGVAVVYQRWLDKAVRSVFAGLPAMPDETPRPVPRTDLTWPIEVPTDWPVRPTFEAIAEETWGTDTLRMDSGFSSRPCGSVSLIRHGLPWRGVSQWCRFEEPQPPSRSKFTMGGMVWLSWFPWLPEGVESLPVRPLWPGFALNTLFYAALVWGVWQLPVAIRRRRRRAKGMCVRCGYDRKGIAAGAVCPECGAGSASG